MPPYKSLKQERYMNWAAQHGKIKQSVVDEFNKASKGKDLPLKKDEGGDIPGTDHSKIDAYKKLRKMIMGNK